MILIIDNYDSFTYNLVQYIGALNPDLQVHRNNKITIEDIEKINPEFCNWQLEYIYEGLEKAGRQRSDLIIDIVVTMSINDEEEKALNDVRAWATSQAATFAVWKNVPPAWERFRGEFTRAEKAYH